MLKILQLTLIMCGLCMFAGTAVHWNAVQQPLPTLPAFFTNPDGSACKRPCLFGIQPGETFFHTTQLLQTHAFTHDSAGNPTSDRILMVSTFGPYVTIAWEIGKDRVASVLLHLRGTSDWQMLGSTIMVLGSPERIRVDDDHTHTYWYGGQEEYIYLQRQPGFVNPDDVLESIVIWAQANREFTSAMPWRGFRSAEYYSAVACHPKYRLCL